MGREARSEFGESFAPEKPDGHTLGASLMWTSAKANMDSRTMMEIESGGETVEFAVNQAVGSGSWQRLGVFDLVPGATLKIHLDKSYGVVIADGFALVPDKNPAF